MENRDILSVVAPKMSEETLLTLFTHPEFRDHLTYILKTQNYWYERSMYSAGKTLQQREEVDWKSVYYMLEKIKKKPAKRYIYSLDSLNTLLITEEVYGPITGFSEQDFMNHLLATRDVDVFRYLLDKAGDAYDIWMLLGDRLENKNREIVDYLVTLLPDNYDEEIRVDVLEATIDGDRPDLFKTLMKYRTSVETQYRVLRSAIEEDSVEIYKYMKSIIARELNIKRILTSAISSDAVKIFSLEFRETDNETDMKLYLKLAVKYSSLEIVKYLEPYIEPDWIELAEMAIRSESGRTEDVIRYAFSRIDPDIDLNHLLLLAAQSTSQVFEIVLSDPRSNPKSNLRELIYSNKTNSLIQDPRIRTEELESDLALAIFRKLDSTYISNMKTWYSIGTGTELDLAHAIEGEDAYSLTLREMVLKRPNREQLITWMTEVKLPDISEAAACVLDDERPYSERIAPLRALLLSILYPTLALRSLEEQLEYLVEEGQSHVKSGGILGVYYALTR